MKQKFTRQQQLDIINECRSSGLPDYQWCRKNGIAPSSFYRWVVYFREHGVDLPVPTSKDDYVPTAKQDVVKLEIVDSISLPDTPNPSPISVAPIEICIGKATIKISNDIDTTLLAKLMTCLGGCV